MKNWGTHSQVLRMDTRPYAREEQSGKQKGAAECGPLLLWDDDAMCVNRVFVN